MRLPSILAPPAPTRYPVVAGAALDALAELDWVSAGRPGQYAATLGPGRVIGLTTRPDGYAAVVTALRRVQLTYASDEQVPSGIGGDLEELALLYGAATDAEVAEAEVTVALDRHDWHHAYTEDGAVFRRGAAEFDRILFLLRQLPFETARALYDTRKPVSFAAYCREQHARAA